MKYKIPDIKIPSSLTIKQRMSYYCNMAFEESICDKIHCNECLFSQSETTPEQKEQFLEWERMIKQTGENNETNKTKTV